MSRVCVCLNEYEREEERYVCVWETGEVGIRERESTGGRMQLCVCVCVCVCEYVCVCVRA